MQRGTGGQSWRRRQELGKIYKIVPRARSGRNYLFWKKNRRNPPPDPFRAAGRWDISSPQVTPRSNADPPSATTKETDRVDELCNATGIEYKAYLREFPETGGVIFLVATCWYPSYGSLYEVYVQADEGTWEGWELRQRGPDGMPLLNSYHVASGIRRVGLPEGRPSQIQVQDASGSHTVDVEPWS